MKTNQPFYTNGWGPDGHGREERSFYLILLVSLGLYTLFALWAYSIPTPKIKVPQFQREVPRTARFILPTPKPEKAVQPTPQPPPLSIQERRKIPEPETPDTPSPPAALPEPLPVPERAPETDRDIAMKSGLLKLLATRSAPEDGSPEEPFSPIEHPRPLTDPLERDDMPLAIEKGLADEALELPEVHAEVRETELSGRTTTAIESPFKIKGTPGGPMIRSEASILKVIQAHQNGLTYLYNRALQRQPDLKGTVTVEFTIQASGEVSGIKIISSTLNGKGFERSIRHHIGEWQFDRIPKGEVVVVYPIGFSPA